MSSLGNLKAEKSSGVVLQRLLEIAAQRQEGVSAWQSNPVEPASYDGIFDRLALGVEETQSRLAAERKAAGARWEALLGHPQARRLVRIRNDRRFQTWGFYEFLLAKSRKLAANDPRTALQAAELALAVARCLDPAEHGEERTADFQSEAHAAIAEARRGLSDRDGAWQAFEEALNCMEDGTGDPLVKAELEHLRARLLGDSGRAEEATEAGRRAGNLFRKIGDLRMQEGHLSHLERLVARR
ncbi:MAG TPA: hypothetical protein VKK31_09680 [Thermoanaerobaculia bacterium]|nr:hypothetical protein [Thermoanaerobaculia bacterium]